MGAGALAGGRRQRLVTQVQRRVAREHLHRADAGAPERVELLERQLVAHLPQRLALLVLGIGDFAREQRAQDLALLGAALELARDVDLLRRVEQLQDVGVRAVAERAEQRRRRKLLLLVDVDEDHVMDVDRELDPRAPERDDARREQALPVGVDTLFEHHARRAVQLRHDHALRAVDDERAERRQDRQLAEIDFLLDDVLRPLGLGGLAHLFHDDELQRGLEGDGVRHVPLDALLDGILGLPERVLHELEGVVPVHVLDREHVLEHPRQPDVGALGALAVRLEERLERARLDVQEVRHRHPLVELRERQNRQRLRHVETSSKCEKAPGPRPERRAGVDRGARASEQQCGKSAHVVDQRRPESRADGPVWPAASVPPGVYFSSTTAPCASSFFLISSASCLDTPSFTVPGAPSTRSLASFRPRLVIARTSLMTWIFFSPPLFSTTVNSVCSSAAGAAAPPPAAAPPAAGAAAAGAVIVTPNFSLNASISSANSNTDMFPTASRMSPLLKLV